MGAKGGGGVKCPVCNNMLEHRREIEQNTLGGIEVRDTLFCFNEPKHLKLGMTSVVEVAFWDKPQARRNFLSTHVTKFNKGVKHKLEEMKSEQAKEEEGTRKPVKNSKGGGGTDPNGGSGSPGSDGTGTGIGGIPSQA